MIVDAPAHDASFLDQESLRDEMYEFEIKHRTTSTLAAILKGALSIEGIPTTEEFKEVIREEIKRRKAQLDFKEPSE